MKIAVVKGPLLDRVSVLESRARENTEVPWKYGKHRVCTAIL